MLITNPKEFEHVAREWAIKYAGAPRGAPGSEGTGAEGSGGVTEETLKNKEEQKRDKAEAAKIAQYAALTTSPQRSGTQTSRVLQSVQPLYLSDFCC